MENQENQEPQTISIDGKKYDVASLGEKGTSLIANIQRMDGAIEHKQFELNMAQLAKAKLIDELSKEVPNFTEVK